LLTFLFLPLSCSYFYASYDESFRYFINITLTNISDTPLVYETNFPIDGDKDGLRASGILHKDETGILYDAELISDCGYAPSPSISFLSQHPHFFEGKLKIYDYSPDDPEGKGDLRVSCNLLALTYVTKYDCSVRKDKSKVFYSHVFRWNNPPKYIYDE